MIRSRHLCFIPVLAAALQGCFADTSETDTTPAIAATPVVHPRRATLIDAAALGSAYENRIAVKMREHSGVRPRGGLLQVDERRLLGAHPRPEIDQLEQALGGRRYAFTPMHDQVTEEELDELRAEGEGRGGAPLPDLNLWMHLYVDVASADELAEIINALNTLDLVEVAEPSRIGINASLQVRADGSVAHPVVGDRVHAPWPVPEQLKPVSERAGRLARPRGEKPGAAAAPPVAEAEALPGSLPVPVPDYSGQQAYKGAAPTGIDTDYLQSNYWNAAGMNWGYTDIEYDWNRSHTDLTSISNVSVMVNGTYAPPGNADPCKNNGCWHHGTAVIGVLSSNDNGTGTTGMVPDAAVRLSASMTSSGYNLAGAISAATSQFFQGAVILIEQQFGAGWDCNGDNAQTNVGGVMVPDYSHDLVPVEFDSSIRDAIKTATAAGRIVVEAAGNGNCDLDQAGFNGWFSATDATKDSGAILVGAGERNTLDRAFFSTFGARVDTHAEGDWQVTTTGYGDLFNTNGNNELYTSTFAGTSSASSIITGGAVALSSLLWFTSGSIYDPKEIREVLRRDGTAQGTGRLGHVGPRPDMRRQITHMVSRSVQVRSVDFDGDGKTDYSLYNTQTGAWAIYFSRTLIATQIAFGLPGDIPVPADYVDDNRAEIAVFRPSTGDWHVRRWDGTSFSVNWGTSGDLPVPMDFNGNDGKAQMAVVRPPGVGGTTYARWYILSDDRTSYTWGDWGEFGDVPMAADIDGDGRDDRIQFRGTTGVWYIAYASGGSRAVQWGAWGDIPMVYRSGGHPGIAVWRPSNQRFYKMDLVTGATSEAQWGAPGDIPRMMDTNGDGEGERVVFRPGAGVWYNLDTWYGLSWGAVTDVPLGR